MTHHSTEQQTHAVDPARLASGQWRHRAQKTIGQGDIHASYSADRIGMGQPVRKPFTFKGGLWICVSYSSERAEAYQLKPTVLFDGEPMNYAEKVRDGDVARADPNGFYHAMTVKHGGGTYVLCGPPAVFIPGETEQLSMF